VFSAVIILKLLGSLWMAVVLITALSAVLICSTSLESAFGTPFVQKFFYQAGWFDVLLAMLAVNMISAALLRYPFKKKHTGFITTHIGIVLLLTGSLITRLSAVEGQILLYEGEKKTEIAEPFFELNAHSHGGPMERLSMRESALKKNPSKVLADGTTLTLEKILDNAARKTEIVEGSDKDGPNPAIQINLKSQMANLEETFWLVKNNPFLPHSNFTQMGPARFELKDSKPVLDREGIKTAGPTLFVKGAGLKAGLALDVLKPNLTESSLGSTGFRISNFRYFPDARVNANHTLISVSENPNNPAVEFDLTGPKGEKEHHVYFAFFPEFASTHSQQKKFQSDLDFNFTAPNPEASPKTSSPSLTFYREGDQWRYLSISKKGSEEGLIEEGKRYNTGWMDFSFEVKKLLERAGVSRQVEKAKEGKGLIGVLVSLKKNGGEFFRGWVLEDEPKSVPNGAKEIILSIEQKNSPVPFELGLIDFRKVNYPGTRQAASYESDVILSDRKENLTIQKTISMNKPLDYKGYRIFQSSYIEDSGSGEASIFSVAKNPGIWLIYSGAIILFLGVFLVFFVKPFSSFDR
jgi:hypothetical protein